MYKRETFQAVGIKATGKLLRKVAMKMGDHCSDLAKIHDKTVNETGQNETEKAKDQSVTMTSVADNTQQSAQPSTATSNLPDTAQ